MYQKNGKLLLRAANCQSSKIASVVSINSAIKLQDIRARFVPAINVWNELLDKFKINKGKFEYIDDTPEYPKFNYHRNYLKGVEELGKLMEKCNKDLDKITKPTLIIQSKQDPIVNPKSGKIIFDKIRSVEKSLFEPDLKSHVIINGDFKDRIFVKIADFLQKI